MHVLCIQSFEVNKNGSNNDGNKQTGCYQLSKARAQSHNLKICLRDFRNWFEKSPLELPCCRSRSCKSGCNLSTSPQSSKIKFKINLKTSRSFLSVRETFRVSLSSMLNLWKLLLPISDQHIRKDTYSLNTFLNTFFEQKIRKCAKKKVIFQENLYQGENVLCQSDAPVTSQSLLCHHLVSILTVTGLILFFWNTFWSLWYYLYFYTIRLNREYLW